MAVLVWSLLGVAFLLGVFLRSRWRAAVYAGVAVALGLYGLTWLTGGFEDDREGTAWILTLVYGVPLYIAFWAGAVGVGYMVRRLFLRAR
jgi:galactitol-specific phosphotransferase system IIC component